MSKKNQLDYYRSFAYHAILCFIILIAVKFTGCGGGSDGNGELSPSHSDEPSEIPGMMALVLNEEGNPVKNAIVGGVSVTDGNGLALGDSQSYSSGWMTVKALGHVQGYAKPEKSSLGTALVLVTVPAVDDSVLHRTTEPSWLFSGAADQPEVEVMLDSDLFEKDIVAVNLAEVDPMKCGPVYAALDNGADMFLHKSFSLEATDLDGDEVPFADGKTVTVNIRDQGEFSGDALVAYFDVTEGEWNVIPNSLSRLDVNHVQCILPHFSSFGIFSGGHPDYTDGSDTFYEAWVRLNWIFENAENNDTTPDEHVVREALEDLADAAKEYANTHRNESGKHFLMLAYQTAAATGNRHVESEMQTEVRELTKELGEKLLDDPGCGKVSELLVLATQAMLVGELEPLADRLSQKAAEVLKNCTVWTGHIHYRFEFGDQVPDAEELVYYDGSRAWHEKHDVIIAIKENGLVDGESHVTNEMSEITYRHERQTSCGPLRIDHIITATPNQGNCTLTFEGSFENNLFNIGPVGLLSSQYVDNTPVGLSYTAKTLHHSGDECTPYETETTQPLVDYYSQLIHGFLGYPQPPDIGEILNNGDRSSNSIYESIRGSKIIYYTSGENITPPIPIEKAHLSWRFYRLRSSN